MPQTKNSSKDPNIIPRDIAGNIAMQEDATDNPLLLIDPVTTQITTKSALRVLDTQFRYFKFPVTTQVITTEELAIGTFEQTIPKTELALPVPVDSRNQPQPYERIDTISPSLWWYYDGSTSSSGYKELPWFYANQITTNAYTLTKEMIDTLREQGKTLRFTIQTQFRLDSSVDGKYTGYNLLFQRRNKKSPRTFHSEVVLYTTEYPGESSMYGMSPNRQYPTIQFQYFVDMNDVVTDDTYIIEVVAQNVAYSLNDAAYWIIEVVDAPTSPALFGWYPTNTKKNAGIWAIGDDTVLFKSKGRGAANQGRGPKVGQKTLGTAQKFTFNNSAGTVSENEFFPIE
jgi:hypothetical protein